MYKIKIYLLLVVMMSSLLVMGGNHENPFGQITFTEKDDPTSYACIDLQRYIGQMTGSVPEIVPFSNWEKNHKSSIVITNVSMLNKYLSSEKQISELGEEGFAIKKISVEGKESIMLCANTPLGKTNAVYGLLKELGCEFRLGSEYVPSKLPETFTNELIIKKPAFNVRGVLPWYNFFNSPTSWDPLDHRAFIDQMIRCGANTITFHTYDSEPFGGYEENGIMNNSQPLKNSGKGTWGTNPMKTSEFLFGTQNLFNTEFFGSKTTMLGLGKEDQIKKEMQVLKDAFEYAKIRGIKTGLGFEAIGDPTIGEDRDRFIRQFESIIKFYDCLDFIVLWQEETKGAQGHPLKYNTHILPKVRDPKSKIINYGKYRREVFKRIVDETKGESPYFQQNEEGKISRATEGARLEMYGKLAHRILSRYEKAPQLVISGWGGETRIVSAEYYDGLDKLLSKDIVFSSLDHIIPQPKVDGIYTVLPPNRQRWPIPWLENDGDQWHPQPHVYLCESTAKSMAQSGSQGFLAIHWRTRDIEINYGYLNDFAWDTTLTAEKYFQKFSKKYEDSGHANEVKEIMSGLDNLGYRWVGGQGQNECAKFTWGPGEDEKLNKLIGFKTKLDSLLPTIHNGKEYVEWINHQMQWIIDYQAAELKGKEAKDLMEKLDFAEDDEQKVIASKVIQLLSGNELAKAMHSYAKSITTRGELGVLATINTKAGKDWNDMLTKSRLIIGLSGDLKNEEWVSDSQIIVPRFLGSINQGDDIKIDAIILGGASSVLSYRILGTKKWRSLSVRSKSGWVQTFLIPGNKVAAPAIEYKIEEENTNGHNLVYGPVVISVFEGQKLKTVMKGKNFPNDSKIENITISKDKNIWVIKWDDLDWADYYQVYINDKLVIETPLSFYPTEKEIFEGQKLTIKAVRGEKIIAMKEEKTN